MVPAEHNPALVDIPILTFGSAGRNLPCTGAGLTAALHCRVRALGPRDGGVSGSGPW